ncbi:MAG: helix-turn-helix domain-containing protein [Chloroflexi bacterium]|nr:helix-turn-helix domain-containing protein [Chloroflexota bacterium]
MNDEGRPATGDFLTMQDAAEFLAVSRFRMARLVKEHRLPVYERATDRRIKLLRRTDIERLLEPHPKARAA